MKLKKLVLAAILSALSIVLYEFLDIKIPPTSTIITISIGIIPIFFIAYYCGPFYSIVSAVIIDILGFFLFGSASNPFMIGCTINAFLSGLFFGVFLKYRKLFGGKLGKILILILELIVSLILIPIFAVHMYNNYIPKKYTFESVVYVVSIASFILNIAVIIYSLFVRSDEDSTLIALSYITYQVICSLILTPTWIESYYKVDFMAQWITRLISVPITTLIYAMLTRLILVPLKARFKVIKD